MRISIIIFLLCFAGNINAQHHHTSKAESVYKGNVHKGIVKEVLNTSAYTYIQMLEGDSLNWLAVRKREVKLGATYYYPDGMEMRDFKSGELDRVFKKVIFLAAIHDFPPNSATYHEAASANKPADTKIEPVNIEHDANSIPIAKLLADVARYEGQQVVVKGQVVKYNQSILNCNWVHIQDGTEFNGSKKLIVTTSHEVKVGDVVIFEATVVVDKDFGYGYRYDIILEEGKRIDE
ncbi:hypothetical protein [Carboxylicivirga marina]|uniref:GW domain-containing protein n=1 Tax=Carboxylicivirga marina TaxID=2800988 RepID=A0ABS1HEZ8_9BACT|nr:hypothetical protein [Carboxylicivirga marina]MBK3515878.1 hypothetical protein [Carboxylicivirga marina]